MDTNSSPASEPPPPVSTDPENYLEKKKGDLLKAQEAIATNTQTANFLQTDIEALQAMIAERKLLLGGYDAQKLQRQLDDDNTVINTKIGIAVPALKDKKAAIDMAIKAFEDNLNDQGTAVGTAKKTYTSADGEAKTAADDAQKAQQKYEDAKNIQNIWFRDITVLLDQAKQVEAQGESGYVPLYFLAGEAKKTAEKFKTNPILSKDDYKKLLDARLSESETARENANAKKATAERALKDFNEKTKKHDAAKASWRTDTLNALKRN